MELRSLGNYEFSEILSVGASDLRNYEAVLAYIFRDFRMRSAFSSPGKDFGCAGAALGGTRSIFQRFFINMIDSEAKFESNSKQISIEVNRILMISARRS